MNYLTEILAFYKWLETHPLSPLLQAYWHLLMYYNNKAAQKGVSPAAVTKAYKRALLAMRKKAA